MEHNDEVIILLNELKQTGEGINRRLDTLNGSVAKHADRLANHDIINTQTTLSQQQMLKELNHLTSSEEKNNDFRVSSIASLNTFKWLFGFLGLGNIIMFAKTVLKLF